MATGSDQFKYSTKETKGNRAACCSVCSEDGSYTPARHYCVDCELYFCGICVKGHLKIPALKSHQVNDIESSTPTSGYVKTQEQDGVPVDSLRCQIHQGKLIDTYCKGHGEVCCGTCALVKHRLCSTESIANAPQDFQSKSEASKCKDALTQVFTQLTQAKEKRTENIDRLGKQKLEQIETIDKYEEMIIAKVKELANISRTEIRSKYEEDKTAIDMDVAALDAAMITTADYVNKLEVLSNEQILFATIVNSEIVTRDGENLLEAMMKDWKERDLNFHIDKTLEDTVDGIQSLGVLEDDCTVTEYEATLAKKVNVVRGDESHTFVYDMCLMDNGELLLADYHNKKLKRYNSDLQYKDEMQLHGSPVAVCKIGKQEVAVRSYDKIVHFVSVGQSMQLISSFTLKGAGYGMAYDAAIEEILACEGKIISVYSKTGNKLRTYDQSANGDTLFSDCKQITLSDNGQEIYVTNYDRHVVVLDKGGHLKMKVMLSNINHAWPLCLLPGRIWLTGCRSSGRIVQLDGDGTKIETLIESNDEQTYTYCAVYDSEHSRLLVGGYPGVISVYKLSAK